MNLKLEIASKCGRDQRHGDAEGKPVIMDTKAKYENMSDHGYQTTDTAREDNHKIVGHLGSSHCEIPARRNR